MARMRAAEGRPEDQRPPPGQPARRADDATSALGDFDHTAKRNPLPKADGVTMAGGHGQGACRPCPKGVSREAANINSEVCSGSLFARLSDRSLRGKC